MTSRPRRTTCWFSKPPQNLERGRLLWRRPRSAVCVVPLGDDEHRLLESHHGSQPPLARYVLSPQTGKTHQLRLHMYLAGAPILGDNAYPAPLPAAQEDFHRPLRLSATQLSFRDPFTHDFRTFRL